MKPYRWKYEDTSVSVAFEPGTRQEAVTYEVHDLRYSIDDANRVLQSGAATTESTSSTTNAGAGPSEADPRAVSVGDTTPYTAGRRYELVDLTTGRAHVFEVDSMSASVLYASAPLPAAFAAGSTVRSTHVSFTLADSILAVRERVDLAEPLLVVWTFGDGTTQSRLAYVVRDPDGDVDLEEVRQSVVRLFPDVYTRIEYAGRDTLPDTVAEGYRILRAQLQRDGIDVGRTFAGENVHYATAWWVLLHLAAGGNHPGEAEVLANWMNHCSVNWQTMIAALRNGIQGKETAAVAASTEASTGDTDEPRSIFRQ